MLASVTREADATRVAAIEGYAVLDGPAAPRGLQALVDLAALVCDVPMATVNLVTADEQHQVAAVGLDGRVCGAGTRCARRCCDAGTAVVAQTRRRPPFPRQPVRHR